MEKSRKEKIFMCGICGICYLDKNKKVDKEILVKMTDLLRHRGPDDCGYHVKDNIGFGHRRLSIIDLSTGQQPIFNEDNSTSIIFNGEIYNYHELHDELIKKGHIFKTRSDTETIVHQYEESGLDFVNLLRGMFAIAIWDEKKQELILTVDRIGKKPLFYAPVKDGLIFASELKSLLSYPEIKREINPTAIHDYLTYQYVPFPDTIFKGIYKLFPGHILIYKNGNINIKEYWDLEYEPKLNITEQEAIERTLAIVDDAVKIRLESEVPLGVLLSGGIDSSTIVAFMRKHISGDLKTFSIGFHEDTHNELPFARLVAKKYETNHNEFIVTPGEFGTIPKLVYHFDEPYADSSALPTYHVLEMARKHVTVALNGDGGDESFCGYERYVGLPTLRKYNKIPFFLREFSKPFFNLLASNIKSSTFLRNLNEINQISLYSEDLQYLQQMIIFREGMKNLLYSKDFKSQLPNKFSLEYSLKYFNSKKIKEIQDRKAYSDIKTYLPGALLPKVDRTAMAVALEGRSPLLDYKVMEFGARLPISIKFPNQILKYLLKKAVAPLLPHELLTKPKTGFAAPINNWFRERWRDKIKEILLSEHAKKRNIFDEKMIEKIVTEHITHRSNHGHRLWALMMLELWFQTYIDSPEPPKSPISI